MHLIENARVMLKPDYFLGEVLLMMELGYLAWLN
jgi:hypothetical protein